MLTQLLQTTKTNVFLAVAVTNLHLDGYNKLPHISLLGYQDIANVIILFPLLSVPAFSVEL